MKTLREYISESENEIEEIQLESSGELNIEDIFGAVYDSVNKDKKDPLGLFEDSAVASTGTGGVDMPDAKPVFNKSTFAGNPVIEVDDDTYCNCIKGKVPFKRWAKYVENESLRDEMRKMYHKNNKFLMKNSKTGAMSYVKP
tara:strand:- start:60636 stop:61061 length:426 start_codon:yes stop_codon:yes gene_type:complete